MKKETKTLTKRKLKPAATMEGRENQLVSLAIDLAEQQLMDGTASAQVITHYLKLGSTRNKAEMEKLRRENELLRAKTESVDANKNVEKLYAEAIQAFKSYNGLTEDGEEDLY